MRKLNSIIRAYTGSLRQSVALSGRRSDHSNESAVDEIGLHDYQSTRQHTTDCWQTPLWLLMH